MSVGHGDNLIRRRISRRSRCSESYVDMPYGLDARASLDRYIMTTHLFSRLFTDYFSAYMMGALFCHFRTISVADSTWA